MRRIDFRSARRADADAAWIVRTQAILSGCSSHYPQPLIEAWCAAAMPEDYGAMLEREGFVLAINGGRVLGFAGLKAAAQEVDAVFVHPEAAGRGLGAQLLAHVEAQARQLGFGAVTLHASLNAVAFYAQNRYEQTGKGHHLTRSGLQIACVHMLKRLDGAA